MRALGLCLGLLGPLGPGMPALAGAQPVGSEFQVNSYTTGDQDTGGFYNNAHLVAGDASGNFVVVWNSSVGDGSLDGIFGQRYDSAGVPRGGEFRVNSYTRLPQFRPSVASDSSGNFVVVWESRGQDGDDDGIFGQRYDSTGTPRGAEFRVNSHTMYSQLTPSVASDANGNFVVVWTSYIPGPYGGHVGYIQGQRYDSEGAAQGDEFRVHSSATGNWRLASVASDANGDFIVAWDGNPDGIFGRRFDSEGVAQGDDFQINSYTTGNQNSPSVASGASGSFVVVWQSAAQDGDNYGVFGQRYDSGGVAQGSEFRVNSYTSGHQFSPSVAATVDGGFVVAWNGVSENDPFGIRGRRYDSKGVAQGDEFQINTYTTHSQKLPSVGAMGTNRFVAVWTSDGQDGDDDGIFGQRYDFGGGEAISVVSPNTNVKWRIGSSQKIEWTHNLGQDATFRIELDRDDDGVYEELIAAAAPVDSETRGRFAWTVTAPRSATARMRVSWTEDPSVSDSSDVTFQIRPATLSATEELLHH